MAVATSAATTVAIVGAAASTAAAGYSIYQGEQQKKQAKQALNAYERQELHNAAEQIQISTRGTDLMREESQRTVANVVDALQGGGGRMLGAAIPQLQAGINQTNRQIQVDLDNQVRQREYAIAQEEARLSGMREQRDFQNINAISSQYAAGDQNMWNGINGAIAATGSLGRVIANSSKDGKGGDGGTDDTGDTIGNSTAYGYGTRSNNMYQPFGIGSNLPGLQLSPIKDFTSSNMYKPGLV